MNVIPALRGNDGTAAGVGTARLFRHTAADQERPCVIRRSLIPIAVSIGVTFLVLLAMEAGIRLAGVEPMEWPGIEGTLRFRGFAIDPLIGPRLRPGWTGRWPASSMWSSTSKAFAGPVSPSPASPKARVVFMGDSCSFGWGLNTDETFVALLDARQRVDGAPTLALWNAAYPGTSAVAGEYVLREQILPLKPDVVVLGFSGNNAFRFADVADAARFHLFGLRKLLFHSRLWSVAAAWLANKNPPKHNPRTRTVILELPVQELYRVATVDEFTAAMRAMVVDTRAQGGEPIFLIFPRASGVSTQFPEEDAGVAAARLPAPGPGKPSVAEINLLEVSCLDHRKLADPVREMRAQAPLWKPVYPSDTKMRKQLAAAAVAYQNGDYTAAQRQFIQAIALDANVPLAHYDLGAALLADGRSEGLAELDKADVLACSVFLRHQIVLWRLAYEMKVPVVDLTLALQAHDGDVLFLDPAHPNAEGDRIIADALWPALQRATQREPFTLPACDNGQTQCPDPTP